jgi:hypothetical protein
MWWPMLPVSCIDFAALAWVIEKNRELGKQQSVRDAEVNMVLECA